MTVIDKIAHLKTTPVSPLVQLKKSAKNETSEFNVHVLLPKNATDFPDTFTSIVNQLNELPENEVPLKLSLFIDCKTDLDYSNKYKQVQDILRARNLIIQFSLIAQSPANNRVLMAEITTINLSTGKPVNLKKKEGYTVINYDGLEILIACIQPPFEKNFEQSVKTAFSNLDNIIKETGFRYSEIVRQWNYIEDILHINTNDNREKQNYQVFNDIRAIYYSKDRFHNGYPAATGIGVTSGSCVIEIIAIKDKDAKIRLIQNNRQINAHSYTDSVLIGASINDSKKKSSPKFERAKLIDSQNIKTVLVSGTASIIGEETVYKDDVIGQTLTAIENINILLDGAKCETGVKNFKLKNYRVYIKNRNDYQTVEYICKQKFKNAPGVFVIADVCRDDLLVEIECSYYY